MVDEADKARPRSESMRDPCPRHGPGHGPSPVPSRWRRDPSLYPSHGSWSEVDEQMKLIRVSVATKCEAKPYESSELDSRTAVLETGEVMSLVYRVIIRVIIRVIVGFVMRVKRVIYPCTLGLSPWISPSPGSESRPVRLPVLRCVVPSCLDRPDVLPIRDAGPRVCSPAAEWAEGPAWRRLGPSRFPSHPNGLFRGSADNGSHCHVL